MLGIRVIVARGYERIHRSNLVGMGVVPLTFQDGQNAQSLGLDGTEVFDIAGVAVGAKQATVTARKPDGSTRSFTANVRVDTPKEWEYMANGGILHYVLRQLAA
jgi:aconitate hydratase